MAQYKCPQCGYTSEQPGTCPTCGVELVQQEEGQEESSSEGSSQ